MQFHQLADADLDRRYEHWQSLGWERIPGAEEQAIAEAFSAKFGSARIVLPSPSLAWNVEPLVGRDHRDEVESEVTLKFLHAFRRCVRAGERLLVIDWLHPWFYFDPFGGVAKATRDEWAYPLLPDYLEAYWFLAPDFRFGVLVTTGLAIFGEDLLNAISVDPPVQFLNVCRFRRKADRKRWRKLLVRQM